MESKYEQAIFGGGCFWCTEAAFGSLKGVVSVVPGYSGGNTEKPTYEEVCSGATGHAEVVKIEFNPKEIAYRDLLKVFFAIHDPTSLNRQGNDIGTQYRSVAIYTNEEQKKEVENYIKEINKDLNNNVVTVVQPYRNFYPAEGYHKQYYLRNSTKPYCQFVINPKLLKEKKLIPSF